MKKKILQVPVIVGKGSEQFFVEKDLCIAPSNPPIYKIEKIDKKVVIIDANVIPGKVIFNAYIWKNITYKTVEDVCDGVVYGQIHHATFKIPFGGFVEMKAIGCDKIDECDTAELLEAFVEGEKDFLHNETICKGQKVFCSLLEKDVVKIAFKVVRTEHIPVCIDDDKHDDDKKIRTNANAITLMMTKKTTSATKMTSLTLRMTNGTNVIIAAEITMPIVEEPTIKSGKYYSDKNREAYSLPVLTLNLKNKGDLKVFLSLFLKVPLFFGHLLFALQFYVFASSGLCCYSFSNHIRPKD